MPSVDAMVARMRECDLILSQHHFNQVGAGVKSYSRRFSNGNIFIDVRASDWTAYNAANQEIKSGRDIKTLQPYLTFLADAAAMITPSTIPAPDPCTCGAESDEVLSVTFEITVKIKVTVTDPSHPSEDPNVIAQKYADMAKQYRSIGAYDAQVLEVKKVD